MGRGLSKAGSGEGAGCGIMSVPQHCQGKSPLEKWEGHVGKYISN